MKYIDVPEVQMFKAEIPILDQLCRFAYKPDATFVEIGTAEGGSASILLLEPLEKGGHVYTIDKKPHPNFQRWYDRYEEVRAHLTPLKMTSDEAVKQFEDNSIDLVFVDGDHRYIQFRRDLENWYPKVKKGGMICGHDCWRKSSELDGDELKQYEEHWNHRTRHYNMWYPGLTKALYDVFNDEYVRCGALRLWYKLKRADYKIQRWECLHAWLKDLDGNYLYFDDNSCLLWCQVCGLVLKASKD